MALSNNHVNNICLNNNGSNTCRFLTYDELDQKYYCLKLSGEKSKVEKEVHDYIISCRIKKVDPYSLSKPIGDNCEGYLFLRNLEQGYDAH